MGVANSHRVTVQLQRHLESYYIAKNEWSESLYTSKAAYVAPYSARIDCCHQCDRQPSANDDGRLWATNSAN